MGLKVKFKGVLNGKHDDDSITQLIGLTEFQKERILKIANPIIHRLEIKRKSNLSPDFYAYIDIYYILIVYKNYEIVVYKLMIDKGNEDLATPPVLSNVFHLIQDYLTYRENDIIGKEDMTIFKPGEGFVYHDRIDETVTDLVCIPQNFPDHILDDSQINIYLNNNTKRKPDIKIRIRANFF